MKRITYKRIKSAVNPAVEYEHASKPYDHTVDIIVNGKCKYPSFPFWLHKTERTTEFNWQMGGVELNNEIVINPLWNVSCEELPTLDKIIEYLEQYADKFTTDESKV